MKKRISKAAIFAGKDYWYTHGIESENLQPIMMSDGPHGLRKQEGVGDFLGQNSSKPAVCFPSGSALGCSFDRDLLYAVGAALGQECRAEDIAILLGPGVNHKRSPLCGRNFEYLSEDPVLSGELGAAYVNGIQSQSVGASLKHFAVNSREMGRMVQDSVIDERTLMELYLKQFEIIVRKAQPWTIMCAYNKVNGCHCTENEFLMERLAREKWGFQGAFISDWGAVMDPVKSISSGLNLEMPGPDRGSVLQIENAVRQGILPNSAVDSSAEFIKSLLKKCQDGANSPKPAFEMSEHLKLAQRVAAESAVLLKNENILPICQGDSIVLVGQLAKKPRYQGTGSSTVNPITVDCIYDRLKEQSIDFSYAEGYSLESDDNESLISAAYELAKEKGKVIIVAGLPDSYESEGFDRKSIALPENQARLITELAKANQNLIVVLQCGGVVEMPWINDVRAVLLMHLSGCQGGAATVDLLMGNRNPSGKLAESWPLRLSDDPSRRYYHNELKRTEYREGIFSGYRFYDSFDREVRFPFGHGLSYTRFAYRELATVEAGSEIRLHFTIENIGPTAGAEVIQLYAGMKNSQIVRARKELIDFQKIYLECGESRMITFCIAKKLLAYYNTRLHNWDVEDGTYKFYIGASSRDIRLETTVRIEGNPEPFSTLPKRYIAFDDGTVIVSDSDFECMMGCEIKPSPPIRPFTMDSTVRDLAQSKLGGIIIGKLTADIVRGENPLLDGMMEEAPIRAAVMVNDKIKKQQIGALVDLLNGKPIQAVNMLLKR